MIVRAAVPILALALSFSVSRAQGIDFTQGGPIQVTARDGIEWRQGEQVVIANGDAKAVRGNVTVTADRLFAWYRRKGTDDASAQPASTGVNGATETEGNEVYRLRAEGHVHIFTDTDQAWGDQATYDLDEAVLVLTGHALKLTTPNDTLTSRDTMEYWSQKRMAVARGDAVVVTNDARRVAADTLVAYTIDAPSQAAAKPPVKGQTAQVQTGDTMSAMAGKLQRVEAFGDVSIRTVTDMVTGDLGVYVPDTDIGHLGGHVRITRGLNQVNGSEAVVNMKTGVATLLAGNDGRVTGLVVPNDASSGTTPNEAAPQPPAKPKVTP
jgi:lipopolysaccharide export system protein LptA